MVLALGRKSLILSKFAKVRLKHNSQSNDCRRGVVGLLLSAAAAPETVESGGRVWWNGMLYVASKFQELDPQLQQDAACTSLLLVSLRRAASLRFLSSFLASTALWLWWAVVVVVVFTPGNAAFHLQQLIYLALMCRSGAFKVQHRHFVARSLPLRHGTVFKY